MEYSYFLQINHDYSYRMLSMHASAIYSICQPTQQTMASSAPFVQQLLKGVFRRDPPTRVWAETWDVKKVIDLLHSWGKLAVQNYTRLILKMVMILILDTVKKPSDLNLPRITHRVMQVTADSVTFQPIFGAIIASSNHLYGPTLRWSEDECLHPGALLRE